MPSSRALFLDRDGVINVDRGYVARQADFEWMAGIFDFVRLARSLGFRPVVATNQTGVGRGYYSEAEFDALNAWMLARFAEEGAAIDAVYYCLHHPDAPEERYRASHPWRKPLPGMLVAAGRELDLELGESVLVGDNPTDIAAGSAAGLAATLLVRPDAASDAMGATAACPDLAGAGEWLRRWANGRPPYSAAPPLEAALVRRG